ncbi:hypothetical protein [Halomarina rubra]|uniref:Uncharacterized protein n=1 Tax=Halomarina rubra TaxID=2071873 RepID=A0ABD6AY60_9EURY|nr:hypothetical protein [Halomarina rubra]
MVKKPTSVAATTPGLNTVTALKSRIRRFDHRLEVWITDLSRCGLVAYAGAMCALMVGVGSHLIALVVPAVIGRVSAQGASQAEEIMCQTGAGDAVTLLFGGLALLLLLVAGIRLTSGLNKKGSQRSDKKREGDEQLKGAAYSVGGVFALTAFPLILEQIGLSTISCVQFAPF